MLSTLFKAVLALVMITCVYLLGVRLSIVENSLRELQATGALQPRGFLLSQNNGKPKVNRRSISNASYRFIGSEILMFWSQTILIVIACST
jgi:hypothetical protein